MSADFHIHDIGHSGSNHIAYSGAPEIVEGVGGSFYRVYISLVLHSLDRYVAKGGFDLWPRQIPNYPNAEQGSYSNVIDVNYTVRCRRFSWKQEQPIRTSRNNRPAGPVCTLKSAMPRVAAIKKFKIDNAIQLGCSSIADIYLAKPYTNEMAANTKMHAKTVTPLGRFITLTA